jgi:SAM-dependent methyltransferase
MNPDPWLQRWLPLLRTCSPAAPVLEIGCGTGEDTAVLGAAGLAVTAFDLSAASVEATRLRVPAATVECRDVREPFPVAQGAAGAGST